jgi:hypothetical protein
MVMFQIDSDIIQDSFHDFLIKTFANGLFTGMDGLRETDGKWYNNSYGRTLAFSNLKWITSPNPPAGFDSIRISFNANPFFIGVDGHDPNYDSISVNINDLKQFLFFDCLMSEKVK